MQDDTIPFETIARRPKSERPRERLLRSGGQSLSLRECLAVLIGTGPKGRGCFGVADDFLKGVLGNLHSVDETDIERAFFTNFLSSFPKSLLEVSGLGPANQARLLVVAELIRRSHAQQIFSHKMDSLNQEQRAWKAVRKIAGELRSSTKEWIGFVPVYEGNRLGSFCLVENGTRSHVNFDPADLFSKILALRPKSFYLFHNHPTGDVRPSHDDILLTESVALVSSLLNLGFSGHYIVSAQSERQIVLNSSD